MPLYDFEPCEIETSFSEWSEWSDCNADNCDSQGLLSRTRVCEDDFFEQTDETECTESCFGNSNISILPILKINYLHLNSNLRCSG